MERNVVKYNKLNELNNTNPRMTLYYYKKESYNGINICLIDQGENVPAVTRVCFNFSLISSNNVLYGLPHIPLAQITILMCVRIWDANLMIHSASDSIPESRQSARFLCPYALCGHPSHLAVAAVY